MPEEGPWIQSESYGRTQLATVSMYFFRFPSFWWIYFSSGPVHASHPQLRTDLDIKIYSTYQNLGFRPAAAPVSYLWISLIVTVYWFCFTSIVDVCMFYSLLAHIHRLAPPYSPIVLWWALWLSTWRPAFDLLLATPTGNRTLPDRTSICWRVLLFIAWWPPKMKANSSSPVWSSPINLTGGHALSRFWGR